MKEVPLTKGFVALVSDEDFEAVAKFKWHASKESRGKKHYAVRFEQREGKRKKIRMHRFVVELRGETIPEGMVVDHVNANSLDNRRENLEVVTQRENMCRCPGWKVKKEQLAA